MSDDSRQPPDLSHILRDLAQTDPGVAPAGSDHVIDAMLDAIDYEPYTEAKLERLLRKAGVRCPDVECRASQPASIVGDGDFSPSAVGPVPSTVPVEKAENPIEGESVGHYKILHLLAASGFGTVYLAHDTQLGCKVVLKVPTSSPQDYQFHLEQLDREVRSAMHPDAVTIHDAHLPEGRILSIDMDHCRDEGLDKTLKPGEPLPLSQAVCLVKALSDALHALHGQGILHRDLKPSNIMLSGNHEGRRFVKLLNFGIANDAEGNGPCSGRTLPCVSPEQTSCLAEAHSGICSVGVIIFQMLSGNYPLTGLPARMNSEPPYFSPSPFNQVYPSTKVSYEVEKLVRRYLAKEPEDCSQADHKLVEMISDAIGTSIPVWIGCCRSNVYFSFSRAAPPDLLTNSIGMELRLIRAGEFLMGSNGGDDDEKPPHRVRVTRSFYLNAHEVTQGQYRQVMGHTPSEFTGSDSLPVERVSWFEAVAFCNALSEMERLTPCYEIQDREVKVRNGVGYRLPTESEWEYACRAGGTGAWCFGDAESDLGKNGWFIGNSDQRTHPVGEKCANEFGLFDMLGNVWEWCWDWYDSGYYAERPNLDPAGPRMGIDRVIRGGSWRSISRSLQSAHRSRIAPSHRSNHVGFRIARVLPDF
jgi:formylglycine-generating enzyme required for sulfatase activity